MLLNQKQHLNNKVYTMKILKHKFAVCLVTSFLLSANSLVLAKTENNNCLAPFSFIKQTKDVSMKKAYLSLYNDNAPNKYYHKHHVARVTDFMQILTKKANLTQNEQDMLFRAALLHDLGSLNENFDITRIVTNFVNKNFTTEQEIENLGWYHRRGVFGENDFLSQLNKTLKLLKDKGIHKETGISPAILRAQVQQRNEFTPFSSVQEAEKNGIILNDLEKALIMFHHTEPKYITMENLQKTFPNLKSKELKKLYDNTHRLLPFLIACDTLEASSNTERDIINGNTPNKSIENLYFYMNSRLAKDEINETTYELITSLLKKSDTDLLNVIKEARNIKELPKEDLLFLSGTKYNSQKISFNLLNLHAKNINELKNTLKTTTFTLDGIAYSPDYIEFNDDLFVIIETPTRPYIYFVKNAKDSITINTSSRIDMLKSFFDTDRLMKHCANLIARDLKKLLKEKNMLKSLTAKTITSTNDEFSKYNTMLKNKKALIDTPTDSPLFKRLIIKTAEDKIEIVEVKVKSSQLSNFNKRMKQLAGDLDKAAKFSTITDEDASRNILYPEFSLFDLMKPVDTINPFVKIDNMDEYTEIQKKTDLNIFGSVYKFWKYTFAHISDHRIVKEILDTDYYLLNLQALMDEAYSATNLSSCSYKKVGSSVMLRDGKNFMVIFGANGLQTDVYDDKTFTEMEARHSIANALAQLNIVNKEMSEEEITPYIDKVISRITKKPGLPDFSCVSLSENISQAFGLKNYRYCRRDKIKNEQKIPRDRCPSLCAERSGIRRYGAAKYIAQQTGQNIALVKLIKFPNNEFSAMYYNYETKVLKNIFFTQSDIDATILNGNNNYDDMLVIGNLNPCYHCMTAFKDTLKKEYPAAKFAPKAVTVIASELNMHKKDLSNPNEEYIDAEDILSINIGVEGNVKILNMPRYNIDQTNHLLQSLNAEKYGPDKMYRLFDQKYLLSNSINSSLFKMITEETMKDQIDDVRETIKILKKYNGITDHEDFLKKLPLNSINFVEDMLKIIHDSYRIIAPGVKYTAREALIKIKASNDVLAAYIIEQINNPYMYKGTYKPLVQLDTIHKNSSIMEQAA